MKTPEKREVYCRAQTDCMSHDCGSMGTHGHGQTPAQPAQPEAKKPKS